MTQAFNPIAELPIGIPTKEPKAEIERRPVTVEINISKRAIITENFNPIAELVLPIGIPTKEARAEIETHPVTVEISISECSI